MTDNFLDGKSVLVTGGTGSFGQHFIRTLLHESGASRIIIFSRDELKQSQMAAQIVDPEGRLRFFLGDVRDVGRLERAFYGIQCVVHAAALKQVPLLEYNPFEAIQTNIIGTQNVITAAINQGVEKVVLISTDKAANPANLYGATKLCAERLMVSSNVYSAGQTKLSVVRYGNVFGSRGSLVQIIEQQRISGRVTLTHVEMTRFWITLKQGVQLVFLALGRMHGGEIFVPKIPSMRIKDFIEVLAPDCEIEVVGIRPGEKLHEMLITPEEGRCAREYDSYYVILPPQVWAANEHPYQDALPAPEGFSFTSLSNSHWLTSDQLRALLKTL